jgi:predicted nucleic acid-binding protein
MPDRRFTLDTNILVYALDREAGERHVLARDVVARAAFADCWLTLQAVSEFYAAVTRKRLVAAAEAAAQAEDWLSVFPTVGHSVEAVRVALDAAAHGRMGYWDALLVSSAAEAGCIAILTEDLAVGSRIQGVLVINPFADGKLDPVADSLLRTD